MDQQLTPFSLYTFLLVSPCFPTTHINTCTRRTLTIRKFAGDYANLPVTAAIRALTVDKYAVLLYVRICTHSRVRHNRTMMMDNFDYIDAAFDGLECDMLDRMDTDSLLAVLYADASHANVAAWAENSIEQVTP